MKAGVRSKRAGPVLIVEYNPINLKLLKLLLTVEGYEVHVATDAEQALELLKKLRPALILMDIQLPGMDGLELARKIKSRRSHRQVIIVAITAYAMKGDEEKALSAGFDDYVLKPIDTRSLPGLIARYLEGQEAHAK